MQETILPPLNMNDILQIIKTTLPLPILPHPDIPVGERLVYFTEQ